MQDEFLRDSDVKTFVAWFANCLASCTPRHSYQTAAADHYDFDGLVGALNKYDWGFSLVFPGDSMVTAGHTYADNEAALERLGSQLVAAVNNPEPSDVETLRWSRSVMTWGGVIAHNGVWLQKNAGGLTEMLRDAKRTLSLSDERAVVRRFNAGMSKIYSLLVDNFIIYDSRVAASLAWFVSKWCHETKKDRVPDLLKFRCLRPKEAADAMLHKVRNPSCGHFKWGWVNTTQQHVLWNLRSSWLLQAALANSPSSEFAAQRRPLRALEAALFMWGYDLSQSSFCDVRVSELQDADTAVPAMTTPIDLPLSHSAGESDEQLCDQLNWNEALTNGGGRAVTFWWRVSEGADGVVIKRENQSPEIFSFGELFSVIQELYDVFGYEWFPLANNVQRLHAGNERLGLGTIILKMRPGNISHAQTASQLGVVMERLKMFEWNNSQNGIKWRIAGDLPTTIEELRFEALG